MASTVSTALVWDNLPRVGAMDEGRASPVTRLPQSQYNPAFTTYRMPARRNTSRFYDAKTKKPAARQQGTLVEGALSFDDSAHETPNAQKPGFPKKPGFSTAGLSIVLSLTFVGLVLIRRRRRTR